MRNKSTPKCNNNHNAKNIARYCVIYFLRMKIQKLRSCQLSGRQQEHSSEGGRHHGPTRPHAAAPQLNNMWKLFSVSQQNKTYRHIVITSVPLTAFSTLPVLIPSITEIYGDNLHFILQLTFFANCIFAICIKRKIISTATREIYIKHYPPQYFHEF